MQVKRICAPETFPLTNAAAMDPGVAAGDYVTLVYFPGRLEGSLQLYGWLGLNPDLELIQKNGRPLKTLSPKTAMAAVVGITVLAWALLAFLYVIGRYTPMDDEEGAPAIIAMVLAAIPLVYILVRRVNSSRTVWV